MSDTMCSRGPVAVGTDGLVPSFDCDTVSKLLAAATASLYTDREVAKACVQRAADLLRGSRITESKPGQGRSAARGGLPLWQKRQLTAYVAANLDSRIRADDLARVVRLSTGHFFRAFRETFGEPPLAYVMRQRIRRSQELMADSPASLSQIAQDCGMCDQAHLTRAFRKIVGVNPSVWRREFTPFTANLMSRNSCGG